MLGLLRLIVVTLPIRDLSHFLLLRDVWSVVTRRLNLLTALLVVCQAELGHWRQNTIDEQLSTATGRSQRFESKSLTRYDSSQIEVEILIFAPFFGIFYVLCHPSSQSTYASKISKSRRHNPGNVSHCAIKQLARFSGSSTPLIIL